MDHCENPMWGSSSVIIDEENTLQNMNWSSPTENLSNDVPPSPFSEFFLPIQIFDGGTNSEGICKSTTENLAFTSSPDRLNFIASTPVAKSPPKLPETNAYFASPSNVSAQYFSSKKPINNLIKSSSSKKSTNRNSDSLFSCDNCSFMAADRQTFMVHKRSKHPGEKSFSCNDCSAKFTRSYSLKRHVLVKHQGYTPSHQLPKYCPFPSCNYVTRNANTMQIHKRGHQNASMYYCKQCKTKYTRRQSLLHHLTQYHSSNAALIGMKKIGVNLTNSVPLEVDGTLENRSKIDTNAPKKVEKRQILVEEDVEKLYNCDKCQFTSKNFLDVYRHKQSAQHVVDDEKTLINKNICLYCHKKFASSNNLLTHIKKQHLESMKKMNETKKMFFCPKCSFSTTRKKVLKAHEDNSHVIIEQQPSAPICFNVATPIRRSPPKSDRNSVQSDGTFVTYGNNKAPSQNINLPNDLPSESNTFNNAACSSYCSFSTSSSSAHDPSIVVANGQTTNNVVATMKPSRNLSSTNSNSNSFDEMASCVQHIQMANSHLLQLCRRRENELKNLRANVIELLKRIYPNNFKFFGQNGCSSLENVDQLVINAINDNL